MSHAHPFREAFILIHKAIPDYVDAVEDKFQSPDPKLMKGPSLCQETQFADDRRSDSHHLIA